MADMAAGRLLFSLGCVTNKYSGKRVLVYRTGKAYGVSFFRRGAKLEAALAAVDGVEDV